MSSLAYPSVQFSGSIIEDSLQQESDSEDTQKLTSLKLAKKYGFKTQAPTCLTQCPALARDWKSCGGTVVKTP
jgi:hypothetical protein